MSYPIEDIRIRIAYAMEIRKMNQQQLSDRTGIPKSSISQYLSGYATPRQPRIVELAKALRVSEPWLMGYDVPMSLSDVSTPASDNGKYFTIKIFGRIPAGAPIEAISDCLGEMNLSKEEFPGAWEYYALQVKGHSMEPKYQDGDTVIVRVQPDCESGQDAVVYVNGDDATLKRVVKQQYGILLQPLNPEYEPMFFAYADEQNPVRIAGVVVEIRRKVL